MRLRLPSFFVVALFCAMSGRVGDAQQARTAGDPVQVYLASLPESTAQFPSLQSTDARVWTQFFDTMGSAAAQLEAREKALRGEVAAAARRREDAAKSATDAAGDTASRVREFEAAERALVRAQQRSGGAASIDTAPEESRLERAQDALAVARDEEARRLERVGRAERERASLMTELFATRTAAARIAAAIAGGPPDLSVIANRELKVGNQTVAVIRHSNAQQVVGVADCDGTRPIILLAPRAPDALTNAAMMFFREHEMAHHVLGHIDCSRGQTARLGGPDQETQADCKAAEMLRMFPDGQRVVDIVFGHFWTWNQPATSTHPSTQARAVALFQPCA
jgi:hypothetical protein